MTKFRTGLGLGNAVVAASGGDPAISSWAEVGSYAVAGSTYKWMAGMTSSRIAVVEGGTISMRSWNGSSWSLVGNTAATSAKDQSTMCKLTDTKACILDGTSNALEVWAFDETDWTLEYTGTEVGAINDYDPVCYLSDNSVAVVTSRAGGGLEKWDYNGTDTWTKDGNTLTTFVDGAHDVICGMTSTRVAVGENIGGASNETLMIYDHDGTDWAQVGNTYTITSDATSGWYGICRVSDTQFAYLVDDTTDAQVQGFVFDGTDITAQGSASTLSDSLSSWPRTIVQMDGTTYAATSWSVAKVEAITMTTA